MNECIKCKLWDMAAKEAGKAGGMCKECFDKSFFDFKPTYERETQEEDNNYFIAKNPFL